MKYIPLSILPILAAGVISCSGSVAVCSTENPEVISLKACSALSKSVVSGGSIPESYTIYLSSSLRDGAGVSDAAEDYFVGMPFRFNNGKWCSSPELFWPLGASLDFLAIASEDSTEDFSKAARWHEMGCSRGVEVTVQSGTHLDSEILFAQASGKKAEDGNIILEFQHSQSWLQFRLISDAPEVVRIDSLVIEKAYSGGTLRVTNGIYMDALWQFRGFRKSDVLVPHSESLVPGDGEGSAVDILLPQQEACALIVHYSTRTSADEPWDDASSSLIRCPPSENPWFCGMKTVFELTFTMTGLVFSTSVIPWEDDSRDVIIDGGK